MRLLALSLMLLAPAQAHALSCAFGPWGAFPQSGSTGVPTNALPRVFFEGSQDLDAFDVVLRVVDGDAVDVTSVVHRQGSAHMLTLEPAVGLAADTSYVIEITSGEGAEFASYTFATGASSDADNPEMPVLDGIDRRQSRSEWGPTDTVEVTMAPPAESVMHELTILDRSSGDELGVVYRVGFVDEGAFRVHAGEHLCGSEIELDGAVDVVIRAVDLAGNASEPTDQTSATAGGCSSVAAPASFVGLLLALGGVLLRRRR